MSASDRLKREKRALRARARALRDSLSPEERGRASEIIADAVVALPELAGASTVLAFASFGTEVDTAPIVERLVERGVRVALPRVEGTDIVPVGFRPGDALVAAAFGMPEPATGAIVPIPEIDAAVVPGLAFDRRGHRIGYGGGFYDRFFVAARPDLLGIAVCFDVQLVDEVPTGAFDVAVAVVVTERRVVRPGR